MAGNLFKLLFASSKFQNATTGNTLLQVIYKCVEFQKKMAKHYNKTMCMVGSEENVFNIIHNRLEEYADLDSDKPILECSNQNLKKINVGDSPKLRPFEDRVNMLTESNKMPQINKPGMNLMLPNGEINKKENKIAYKVGKNYSHVDKNKAAEIKSKRRHPHSLLKKNSLKQKEFSKIFFPIRLLQENAQEKKKSNKTSKKLENECRATNADNIEANTFTPIIKGCNTKYSSQNPLKRYYHFVKETQGLEKKTNQKNYKDMTPFFSFINILKHLELLGETGDISTNNKTNKKASTNLIDQINIKDNLETFQSSQNENITYKCDLSQHLDEIKEQANILRINSEVFDDTEKNIQTIKSKKFDDIKEQIDILQVNKNMDKSLENIKLIEKSTKHPEMPQNKEVVDNKINNKVLEKSEKKPEPFQNKPKPDKTGNNKNKQNRFYPSLEMFSKATKKILKSSQNENEIYKCDLFKYLDQIREQTRILIMNRMVFDNIEKHIEETRLTNIEGTKEQIDILNINNQVFENMIKVIGNIKIMKKYGIESESTNPTNNKQQSAFETNRFPNFKMGTTLTKMGEKSSENKKINNSIDLDQIGEQTKILSKNAKIFEETERKIQKMKKSNDDSISELIKILEMRTRAYQSMEDGIGNILAKKKREISKHNYKKIVDSNPHQIREQIRGLNMNAKPPDRTEENMQKTQILNADDIKNQINILEINNKVFENMERVIANHKKIEKSEKKPQILQNIFYPVKTQDDIRKQNSMLDINNLISLNYGEIREQARMVIMNTKVFADTEKNIQKMKPMYADDLKDQINNTDVKRIEKSEKKPQILQNIFYPVKTQDDIRKQNSILDINNQFISLNYGEIREQARMVNMNTKVFADTERNIQKMKPMYADDIKDQINNSNHKRIEISEKKPQILQNKFYPVKTQDDIRKQNSILDVNNLVYLNYGEIREQARMVNMNTKVFADTEKNIQKIFENMEKELAKVKILEKPIEEPEIIKIKDNAYILNKFNSLMHDLDQIREQTRILNMNRKVFEATEKNIQKIKPLNMDNIKEQINILEMNMKAFENMEKSIGNFKNAQNTEINIQQTKVLNLNDVKEQKRILKNNKSASPSLKSAAIERWEKHYKDRNIIYKYFHQITDQTKILNMNRMVFDNLEKSIQKLHRINVNEIQNEIIASANTKKIENLRKNPAYIYKQYLARLADATEQAKLIEINKKVCKNMEKVIGGEKIIEKTQKRPEIFQKQQKRFAVTYPAGSKEPTKLLNINSTIFKNMETVVENVNIIKKPQKKPEISKEQKKRPIYRYPEDIKERTNILQINEQVFDHLERVIERITIIETPKKRAEAFRRRTIGANRTSKPVLTKMPHIREEIQVDPSTYTEIISNLQPKFQLYNDTLQEIETIQQESLALLCEQVLQQICIAKGHEVDENKSDSETFSTKILESYPLDSDTESNLSNEQELSENENSEEERVPQIKNIHNKLPLYFRKRRNTFILPETTIWNMQPKLPLNTSTHSFIKQMKMRNRLSKKYKLETREVDSLLGDKIKITRLITETDGQ